MRFLLSFSFLCLVCSCQGNNENGSSAYQSHKPAREVVALHDRAFHIVQRNGENKDSLRLAINILDEAIAKDSDYLLAYSHKAEYMEHLTPGKSGVLLDQYLRRNPDNPYALMGRGLYFEKYGHKDSARIYYQKAEEIFLGSYKSTREPEKLFNACSAMVLLGNKDKAWKTYRKERNHLSDEDRKAYDQMMDGMRNGIMDNLIENFWSGQLPKMPR